MSDPTVCCIGYHIDRDGHLRRAIVKPPDGMVHCYDCGLDKMPDQFQIGIRGKPSSPCIHCRARRFRKYVSEGRRVKTKTSYKATKAWSQRNPLKKAAHAAVAYALRKGRLIKHPCERCGVNRVTAHHEDYLKKLDVRWLCYACHAKEHWKYEE